MDSNSRADQYPNHSTPRPSHVQRRTPRRGQGRAQLNPPVPQLHHDVHASCPHRVNPHTQPLHMRCATHQRIPPVRPQLARPAPARCSESSAVHESPEMPSLDRLRLQQEPPSNGAQPVAPRHADIGVAPMHVAAQCATTHAWHSAPSLRPTIHMPPIRIGRPPGVRPLPHTLLLCRNGFVGGMSKEQFVENASAHLDLRARQNEGKFPLPLYSEHESVFFSVVKPDIPTSDYLKRLVTYAYCSPSAFVVMLIYMNRTARIACRLMVTPFNMHRLLITALVLACKFLDDKCYANEHYAKVGGIASVQEMNRLELQLLKYLDRLFVTEDEYRAELNLLTAVQHPSRGHRGRGEGAANTSMQLVRKNSPMCITDPFFVHDRINANGENK
ncbi:Cyclin-U4-1 [Gracilariopsis chorda]|uniref:Cyclin-U4-1 n=1 Tax=Gracilariopsis chorda TaxID=448386 RepID=A0A2V3II09_9FLOR|nr:Cyclin-U4-1 [Gracilariopsis chorda]|eukprot:PXF41726.1 Cyclin-U4-1 [Gracilariopsis chorda]